MYSAISKNKRNTVLIMAVFIIIIGLIGLVVQLWFGEGLYLFWGIFIGSILYAIFQYFAASKLAMSLMGAKKIEKRNCPRLYRAVENLSITLGLPTPAIYIIDDPAPNAFATGRDPKRAIVGVTTGMLELVDDRELTAVMAHEMGHVQNYDIRVSMITFGLVSAIGLISDIALRMLFYGNNRNNNTHPMVYILGLVAVILAPIAAVMLQMAISRQREYLADASGAMTTRDPDALASALEKLQKNGRPMKRQVSSASNLFLSNPLEKSFFTKLFSSHPPLGDRIATLRKNAKKF